MNLDGITAPQPIGSVAELIDLEESLRATPRRWAFRGQPDEYRTLAPSFQRQFKKRSLGTAHLIERRLIDAFRHHYAHLKDRSANMPQPEQIGADLRCLSVMQHYDIPTRLLDWTASFWTAVYFACGGASGNNAELWFYDRDALAPHQVQYVFRRDSPDFLEARDAQVIVEFDPVITPRMTKQSAHHTVGADIFADHAFLLAELKPPGDPDARGLLRRVVIDRSCKTKALQYLADQLQITASTLFPDVDGLGRFLRWQFESLRTMLL